MAYTCRDRTCGDCPRCTPYAYRTCPSCKRTFGPDEPHDSDECGAALEEAWDRKLAAMRDGDG